MAQPLALASFEDLVRRHQGVVCAVAYSVLRDRARSEEVAQEAFLIAWRKLPTMSPPPAMPGWICGVARKLAANAARRRKETAMDREPESTHTPLDAALDREAERLAHNALQQLSAPEREAIVLFYRNGSSVAEVAGALGVTEAVVRKRLQRGRDRLKSALAAVETTLARTRPGTAFTAACVAAATAGATIDAQAASATDVRGGAGGARFAKLGAAAVGAAAVIGATAIALSGLDRSRNHVAADARSALDHSIERRGNPTGGGGGASLIRRLDPTARRLVGERIAHARIAHTTGAAAPVTTTPNPNERIYDFAGGRLDEALAPLPPLTPPVRLDKATLRRGLREVQPMLVECYREAAPRLSSRDGTVALDLHLVGDSEATVVDRATVELSPTLADRELADCMRETVLAIELPPLADGDAVRMLYSYVIGQPPSLGE